MEKRKAHYSLSEIQRVVEARGVNAFTATALTGAAALGLSNAQAVAVVLELKQKNLYKSMTTHKDHTIWQDVYHATLQTGLVAYIKVILPRRAESIVL